MAAKRRRSVGPEKKQRHRRNPLGPMGPIYPNFKKLIKTICGFSYKWKDHRGEKHFGALEQGRIGVVEISAESECKYRA